MKINSEVLAVETNGDTLSIKLQGPAKRQAEWRRFSSIDITIPDTVQNRRAFHVGRAVSVTVEPK